MCFVTIRYDGHHVWIKFNSGMMSIVDLLNAGKIYLKKVVDRKQTIVVPGIKILLTCNSPLQENCLSVCTLAAAILELWRMERLCCGCTRAIATRRLLDRRRLDLACELACWIAIGIRYGRSEVESAGWTAVKTPLKTCTD